MLQQLSNRHHIICCCGYNLLLFICQSDPQKLPTAHTRYFIIQVRRGVLYLWIKYSIKDKKAKIYSSCERLIVLGISVTWRYWMQPTTVDYRIEPLILDHRYHIRSWAWSIYIQSCISDNNGKLYRIDSNGVLKRVVGSWTVLTPQSV